MEKIPNKYGVSKREWAKWNSYERSAFNFMYFVMTDNATPILGYVERKLLDDKQWTVIAWNTAFIGAYELRRERVVRAREARNAA